VLFGLPHDLSDMPQRAGRAALDAIRVWVQSDAEERLAFFGERAQSVEVTQAAQW
jgi:hypothetical protein